MAYVYLLDLYKFIDQRSAEAGKALEEAPNKNGATSFQEGRIAILADFKDYLNENFHSRLPRKIRETVR